MFKSHRSGSLKRLLKTTGLFAPELVRFDELGFPGIRANDMDSGKSR
jgi:hypothetical protein